jgi:hypothetical protein
VLRVEFRYLRGEREKEQVSDGTEERRRAESVSYHDARVDDRCGKTTLENSCKLQIVHSKGHTKRQDVRAR